ncbi:hypothetical protein MYSTI_04680 [Myxococcus stipitatus DSM 14675]|uniref:DUF4350 domain-containing protein n=1 Tax=Myxococcus stipitatus (strain DSM 14675 / JCM 12634 / Mx s8) TaxID=1278073 RepID=L7UEF1_MYXSD|nr:DUF4350 domain-containing protein [Myxococcus stipitatus]AGC45972.1 hypothetical protein MYSTI_04680 [Myxococcus stipitatus DSM 14675]
MKNVRTTAIFGLLIALALAAGLSTGQDTPDSLVPSVENVGPQGARALFLFLREGGHSVSEQRTSLDSLATGTRTLVLASPTGRPVSDAEVLAVDRFVQEGGTLVYLSPRELGRHQAALEKWLRLEEGPLLPASERGLATDLADAGGTTVDVWLDAGPLRGLSALRISQDRGLRVNHPSAIPLAGLGGAVAVWRVALGQGEVYVLAGADLAENRRLELLDNVRFWSALASRGPLVIDEYHHQLAPPPPLSRGIWVFAAQVLAVAGVYALSRGTRFGEPRPLLVEKHRSALEYVRSMGWLMRRAKVEKELLPELDKSLRQQLQEQLGISPDLADVEAARRLEQEGGVPASRYLDAKAQLTQLLAQPSVRPVDYARVARLYAHLERAVAGQEAPRR